MQNSVEKQGGATATALVQALTSMLLVFALFAMHRALTLEPLAAIYELSTAELAAAVLVGLMSDAWVSALCGLIVLVLGVALGVVGWKRGARRLGWTAFALVVLGLAAHQSYVEFFRFQLLPFHLRYLTDIEFIKANGRSVLNWEAVATVLFALGCGLGVRAAAPFAWLSRRAAAWMFVSILLLAVVLHNRNIHYRVQWFVPENLQVNMIERFYMTAVKARRPPPLSDQEAEFLATELGIDPARLPKDPVERLRLLVMREAPTTDEAVAEPGPSLKLGFRAAVQAGKKPVLAIIMMESLRPAETGYFARHGETSLTPTLDQLARRGIYFTQAFSTGSVTRGGQEAAFCGYLGSRDTSLMRGATAIPFSCLPDHVAGQGVEPFWYHGGEGRFDSQLNFWKQRRIATYLTQADFSQAVPRTSWGVGDVSFFARAAQKIKERRETSPATALAGMLLSVTHHIPWNLPKDAPSDLPHDVAAKHPSYLTTAYFDAALGSFVAQLRKDGAWDDALLILVSDHGNSVPPYQELYDGDPAGSDYLQSHINLLLTGGLVENELRRRGQTSLAIDRYVSQADIAAFVAYVLDLRAAKFMAEGLFAAQPQLPVVSDLELGLFSPALRRRFTRAELVNKDAQAFTKEERVPLLYYRAFLELISQLAKR